MTIAICGSMKFFDSMSRLKADLEHLGHTVLVPEPEGRDTDYALMNPQAAAMQKKAFIDRHLKHIKECDAILVANYEKNNISGYIGANTFLEMGFAYAFGKPIYLLHSVPAQPNAVEISGMMPIVVNGDVASIQ